jgi:hypothetical protein
LDFGDPTEHASKRSRRSSAGNSNETGRIDGAS